MGKAPLAWTAADHDECRSTAPRDLADNPGVTQVETMSDADIREYIEEQLRGLERLRGMAQDSMANAKDIFPTFRRSLALDLIHLQEINRLPGKFADLDPMKEFPDLAN